MTDRVRPRGASRGTTALAGVAVAILTATMGMSAARADTTETTAPVDVTTETAVVEETTETAAVDATAAEETTDVEETTETDAVELTPTETPAAQEEPEPAPAEATVSEAVAEAAVVLDEPAPAGDVAAEAVEVPAAVSYVYAWTDYDRGVVEVDWDVSSPVDPTVTSYVVSVDGTPFSVEVPATDRHVTLTELSLPRGSYDVSVVARNAAGDSAPTTSFAVYMANLAPSAPQNLTISEPFPGELTVDWEAPVGSGTGELTNYYLELERPGEEPTRIAIEADDIWFTTTEFTFQWLKAGTYTVTVSARNEDYVWGPSSVLSYEVEPAAPTAPGDVVARQVEYVTGAIDVFWTGPQRAGTSNIVLYTVTLASAEHSESRVMDASGDRTTFGNLPAGTYTATVTVTNAEGLTSPGTSSREIDILAVAPTAPENVELGSDGRRDASVSWEAPTHSGTSAIDYYEVYLQDSDGTRTPVQRVSGPDGASFSGLRIGTHWAYVYAVNLDGETSEHTRSDYLNVDAVAPTAPRDVVAVADAPTQISVSWTAPADSGTSDVHQYAVTLFDADGVDWRTVYVSGTDPLTAVLEDVAPGSYTVAVTATNGDSDDYRLTGPAGTSNVVTVADAPTEPEGTVPSVPRNVTVTQTGPRQVTVRFDAATDPGSSPVTGYGIGVSAGESGWGDFYPASTRVQVFDDIDPGTYVFSVAAFNEAGHSPFVQATVTVRAGWAPPVTPISTVPVITPIPAGPAGTAVVPPSAPRGQDTGTAHGSGALARTGTEAGTVLLTALALIVLGGTALAAGRRPHRGQPS